MPKTRCSRIIAVANQKGGVGKTTTAINLSTAMAAVGREVLIFDLDPQGNASTGLGIERKNISAGSYEVLIGDESLHSAVVKTEIPHLSIVPASSDLSGAELELVGAKRREYCLKRAFAESKCKFDYILIDCPPALGLLTLNALTVAQGILVPLQCEYLALEGLSQLVKTAERVKKTFNPNLKLQGIVLTMFDSRNNLSALVSEDVREYFGRTVYKAVIPRNVKVSEAPSHGRPVLLYDFNCPGSQAYVHLAAEVLRREEELD
ncbi:MAG: chromosome partitioning protein ParA [Rhodospirillaceae bacterium]|nr:chromosome partitioning protein ParA [Rhodospirillaceae bacterium]|tara:strand:+ start:4126 stop:4914 length:789 start_codon:yes stop_codon:yes gene_type:complete